MESLSSAEAPISKAVGGPCGGERSGIECKNWETVLIKWCKQFSLEQGLRHDGSGKARKVEIFTVNNAGQKCCDRSRVLINRPW